MVSEDLFSRKALIAWIALILGLAPAAAAVRPMLSRPTGYWPMLILSSVAALALLRPLWPRWLEAVRLRPRWTVAGTLAIVLFTLFMLVFYVTIPVERFHFVLFGVLGVLFGARNGVGLSAALASWLGCGIVATADELIQLCLASRVGDPRDIGLNSIVSSIGVLFTQLLDLPAGRVERRALAGRATVWIGLLTWFYSESRWGHVIPMPGGSFFSTFSDARLVELNGSRNYVQTPPASSSDLLAWKDRYFIEGMERLQHRNEWVKQGQWPLATFDNAVLEQYYAPILDARKERWVPAMVAHVQAQSGGAPPVAPLHSRDGPTRRGRVVAGLTLAALATLAGVWPRRRFARKVSEGAGRNEREDECIP